MEYIIGSLVGAVIGYITNWLAIKMLFRPHKELRIGKFRVPFTPGLIPKEKYRIAKSVGETIGEHLLTKETIIKSLCSEDMNTQLDSWVKHKVVAIGNSEVTVGSEIKTLLGDEYTGFINNTTNSLSELILNYINQKNVKQEIAKYSSDLVMVGLKVKPQVICGGELYNLIKDKIFNMATQYKNSEDFYREIETILQEKIEELKGLDKSFEEVIPGDILNNIKVHVYGKKYDIAMEIKKMLKEEKNKQKLKQIVKETISTKLSPMIAMFLNGESTYEKVANAINEFLDDEKNHDDIAAITNDIIDKLMKSSISSVTSELSEAETKSCIKLFTNLFTTKILDEKLIISILDKFQDKFNKYISIEDLLEKSGINFKSIIEEFIESRINSMSQSDSFKIKITEIVSIMINKFLSIEMKSLFKEEGDKVSRSISKIVRDLYNKFIENKAGDVIEVLGVAKIVEDQINEFDVEFTEKIILEIASKELSAITWLGALLGAIMGLLSPILGSL